MTTRYRVLKVWLLFVDYSQKWGNTWGVLFLNAPLWCQSCTFFDIFLKNFHPRSEPKQLSLKFCRYYLSFLTLQRSFDLSFLFAPHSPIKIFVQFFHDYVRMWPLFYFYKFGCPIFYRFNVIAKIQI